MLKAVDGGFCLLEVLETLEVMRRLLLCILEAVESQLCLLDVLEVMEAMRCMLLCRFDGGWGA